MQLSFIVWGNIPVKERLVDNEFMREAHNKLENYYKVVVPPNLSDDEYIRVSAFRNKDERQLSKVFFIKSHEELTDLIKKYKHNWNLYINSATVRNTDSGKLESLYRRQIIFLDFDKKDYPQYSDIKEFTAHIKQKLPQLFNHCIVDSGNGFHFYVAIKPTKDIRRVTRVNKHIAMLLGADLNAVKPTQIMRIPTSLNLKGEDPKAVSVISNTFGTERFRPYELKQLESMIAFAQKNVQIDNDMQVSQPKVEYLESSCYYCIEKMINEGADKGERNYCLGRIIKYLQIVRGYNEFNALQAIKEWNNRCRPAKDFEQVIADFKSYWNKQYALLGCTMPDERQQAILAKYCDHYQCKTIHNGETRGIIEGKELNIDNHLLDNKTMRKLSGNHYLILTMLHIHEEGLSLNQLKQSITSRKSKKPCLDQRTLNKVLSDLIKDKYISLNSDLYKLIDIKNYGAGFTRYYYSVSILLINKIITSQQYLTYLALVRNLQQGRDVTYNTLANDLDMDTSNVGKNIKALHEGQILKIEKIYTEKGVLANRYVLVA